MQVVASLVSCALARLSTVALAMLGRARGFDTPNQHALPRPLPAAPIEGFNMNASNPLICIAAIHIVCSISRRQCRSIFQRFFLEASLAGEPTAREEREGKEELVNGCVVKRWASQRRARKCLVLSGER